MFTAILCVILAFYARYNSDKSASRLLKNGVLTTATTYDYHFSLKGAKGYSYRIVVNGKGYDGFLGDGQGIGKPVFLYKTFPVIYNREDPSENRMLVSPRSFEFYGLSFPDSLKWVLQYEE